VLGDGRGQQVVGLRRALVDRGRVYVRGQVNEYDRRQCLEFTRELFRARGHLDPQLVALGAVAGAGEVERAGGAAEQVAPGGAARSEERRVGEEGGRVGVVVVLGDGSG